MVVEAGRGARSPVQPALRESGLPPVFDEERVLPSQYLPEQRVDCGERRLLRGVLEQALHDLKHRKPSVVADALAWFHAPRQTHLYDFESICEVLGFEVSIVRREIAKRGPAIARAVRPRWASGHTRGLAPRLPRSVRSSALPEHHALPPGKKRR